MTAEKNTWGFYTCNIYLYLQFITWAMESKLPSPKFRLHFSFSFLFFFGSKVIFIFLVPKISLLVLHRILFPIFAQARTFF
jgi:hypothetical protein